MCACACACVFWMPAVFIWCTTAQGGAWAGGLPVRVQAVVRIGDVLMAMNGIELVGVWLTCCLWGCGCVCAWRALLPGLDLQTQNAVLVRRDLTPPSPPPPLQLTFTYDGDRVPMSAAMANTGCTTDPIPPTSSLWRLTTRMARKRSWCLCASAALPRSFRCGACYAV